LPRGQASGITEKWHLKKRCFQEVVLVSEVKDKARVGKKVHYRGRGGWFSWGQKWSGEKR